MSNAIQRGQSLTLVQLDIPAFSMFINGDAPSLRIYRNGTAVSAGKKEVTINHESNNTLSREVSVKFNVSEANKLDLPTDIVQMMSVGGALFISTTGFFTDDVSDAEIKDMATTIVQRALVTMREQVDMLNVHLDILSERAQDKSTLFTNR